MKRYYASKIYCPYYSGNTGRSIRCRLGDDGDYINPTFSDRTKFAAYRKIHCKAINGHKRCAIYKMLEELENEA